MGFFSAIRQTHSIHIIAFLLYIILQTKKDTLEMDTKSTNGLRWYFIEARITKGTLNIKQFAELTDIPKSCMQRYLNGIGPRDENVLRKIEKNLGKQPFDIQRHRTKLDWEKLVPELYSNKPTLRSRYYYKDYIEEPALVREDNPLEHFSIIEEKLQERCKYLEAENERLKRENKMLQLTIESMQFE